MNSRRNFSHDTSPLHKPAGTLRFMKPNPIRNWSIEFWGEKDGEYHAVSSRGTIEDAFACADESECEFEWQAVRINIVALGS